MNLNFTVIFALIQRPHFAGHEECDKFRGGEYGEIFLK